MQNLNKQMMKAEHSKKEALRAIVNRKFAKMTGDFLFKECGIKPEGKMLQFNQVRHGYQLEKTLNECGVDTGFMDIYRQWLIAVNDVREAREDAKVSVKLTGLEGLVHKRKQEVWEYISCVSRIQTRPKLRWSVERYGTKLSLRGEVHVSSDGKVDEYGNRERISFPIPLNYVDQVKDIGSSIENKVVISAKYLGKFGDVDGYKATVMRKGLSALDWRPEDVYVGKFMDSVKICKSRMHIQQVAKRQASQEFTDELLNAFD